MLDALFQGSMAWFGVPAIVGTAIFVIRLVLMLAGGVAHDVDIDPGVADGIHDAHADPSAGFKALSFQSITAFALGFGWGGIAAAKGMSLSMPLAVGVGCATGVGIVWVLALLLKGLYDLQSSGNVRIQDAIGREGEVYADVPASGAGKGQVRVVFGTRQRICNAQSASGPASTGTRVRVVKVHEDNSLIVVPADASSAGL